MLEMPSEAFFFYFTELLDSSFPFKVRIVTNPNQSLLIWGWQRIYPGFCSPKTKSK